MKRVNIPDGGKSQWAHVDIRPCDGVVTKEPTLQ